MYISYSSLSDWSKCPFYFKLKYIDKIPHDKGSIHTAFGNAVHATNQSILVDNISDIENVFKTNFKRSLKELSGNIKQNIFSDKSLKKLAKEMMEVGPSLCKKSIEELHKQFPGFVIISTESKIIEPIISYMKKNFEFKGILDVVIHTPSDDTIHILDWKTTSWGWDAKKRNDKMTTYQLTYYKHFLSQQEDIELNKIKTHFGLIKRTAKKDNIEIFETKIGKKKIDNALKLLNTMVYNVDNEKFPKNRLSCKYCPFLKTEFCP